MKTSDQNALIDKFLRHLHVERGLSANTISTYLNALRKLILWSKTTEIQALKSAVLQDFVIEMCRETSRRSVHNYISALRTFFKFLLENKIATSDPTCDVVLPKLDRALPKILNRQQIEQLLRAPNAMLVNGMISQKIAARDHMVLEIFYGSGLRISELRNLKTFDIDRVNRVFKVLGKGGKERISPFSIYAMQAIEKFWQICGASQEFLLSVNNHDALTARQIQNRVKLYLKFAGLPSDLSPHTIRHAYATHMLNAGANIRLIQELLGHASLSTTQIYTHIDSQAMKDVHKKCHPRG